MVIYIFSICIASAKIREYRQVTPLCPLFENINYSRWHILSFVGGHIEKSLPLTPFHQIYSWRFWAYATQGTHSDHARVIKHIFQFIFGQSLLWLDCRVLGPIGSTLLKYIGNNMKMEMGEPSDPCCFVSNNQHGWQNREYHSYSGNWALQKRPETLGQDNK